LLVSGKDTSPTFFKQAQKPVKIRSA